MTHGSPSEGFWPLAVAWWTMTAVMMLPVTWPWLRALHRLSSAPGADGSAALPALALAGFAGGYLSLWLAFGLGVAALQAVVLSGVSHGPALRGGVLAVAGLYQLTPAKAACLRHCRSPLAVLLSRWPLGGRGALRLGMEHGLFCLGCCWALMLIGLGAGSMGWIWMAALTVLVAVEKLVARGAVLSRWAGVVLIGLAVHHAWSLL